MVSNWTNKYVAGVKVEQFGRLRFRMICVCVGIRKMKIKYNIFLTGKCGSVFRTYSHFGVFSSHSRCSPLLAVGCRVCPPSNERTKPNLINAPFHNNNFLVYSFTYSRAYRTYNEDRHIAAAITDPSLLDGNGRKIQIMLDVLFFECDS